MNDDHISVREYIERILSEREVALRLTADSLEKRLQLLNELRGDVITKAEYNRANEALLDRVWKLEKWQSKIVGIGAALIALTGLLGLLVGHFWKQ